MSSQTGNLGERARARTPDRARKELAQDAVEAVATAILAEVEEEDLPLSEVRQWSRPLVARDDLYGSEHVGAEIVLDAVEVAEEDL